MPNWCSNQLTLTHEDPALIERAKKAFVEGKLLSEFIPTPAELSEAISSSSNPENDALKKSNSEKYGYPTWYEFNLAKWGTKWDVGGKEDTIEEEEPNKLVLKFDSAWSPPVAAMQELTDVHGFDVRLLYAEEGVAVCGLYTSKNGNASYEIPVTSQEILDRIPSSIDEAFFLSASRMLDEEAEAAEEAEEVEATSETADRPA